MRLVYAFDEEAPVAATCSAARGRARGDDRSASPCPQASPSRPTRAARRCDRARCLRACGRRSTSTSSASRSGREALRRPRRPAARLGPLRRRDLDAGDDGHDPQPGPQRRGGGGLATATRNPRFAFDSYRRLIQMYGEVVDEVDGHLFEGSCRASRSDGGPPGRRADRGRPAGADRRFQEIYEREVARRSPRTRPTSSGARSARYSTRGRPRAPGLQAHLRHPGRSAPR